MSLVIGEATFMPEASNDSAKSCQFVTFLLLFSSIMLLAGGSHTNFEGVDKIAAGASLFVDSMAACTLIMAHKAGTS